MIWWKIWMIPVLKTMSKKNKLSNYSISSTSLIGIYLKVTDSDGFVKLPNEITPCEIE